jgi:hypothetical protein
LEIVVIHAHVNNVVVAVVDEVVVVDVVVDSFL